MRWNNHQVTFSCSEALLLRSLLLLEMYQIDLTGKWTELPQIYQLFIFYRASMVAQLVKNPVQRSQFEPWVGKIPWRREWLPTPVFLPGEFHEQRLMTDYSSWVTKSRTRLSDFHFLFFIFQKCSKTFIYALSSLNHLKIYLAHSYSSLIIQHELSSLRALICAVFPRYK